MIYHYLRYHRLPIDPWYDILIIPYLQAVKKYHTYEHLQKLKFDRSVTTVLFPREYQAVENMAIVITNGEYYVKRCTYSGERMNKTKNLSEAKFYYNVNVAQKKC